MLTIRFELVTGERLVYSDDVDMIIAPGTEGELGILPRHTPLLTGLQPGELRLKKGAEEISIVITGGFMEVLPDKVTVLADAAERAEEIDIARAEAARQRALERLQQRAGDADLAKAQASLQRAVARLKVAKRKRRPGGTVRQELGE